MLYEEERSWDPDLQRKQEEEKKEEEAAEQKEEELEEAAADAGKIMDILGSLVNDMKFEEAVKKFDEFAQAIETTADEGMRHANPQVADFYKKWKEHLYEMMTIIKESEEDPEKKRSKALRALDNAATSKRNAGLLEMREQ